MSILLHKIEISRCNFVFKFRYNHRFYKYSNLLFIYMYIKIVKRLRILKTFQSISIEPFTFWIWILCFILSWYEKKFHDRFDCKLLRFVRFIRLFIYGAFYILIQYVLCIRDCFFWFASYEISFRLLWFSLFLWSLIF